MFTITKERFIEDIKTNADLKWLFKVNFAPDIKNYIPDDFYDFLVSHSLFQNHLKRESRKNLQDSLYLMPSHEILRKITKEFPQYESIRKVLKPLGKQEEKKISEILLEEDIKRLRKAGYKVEKVKNKFKALT